MNKLEHYLNIRAGLQTGDLVEFAGTSLIDRAIRWRTGQIVNHTAVVIRFSSYYRDRLFVTEALKLVMLDPLSTRLKNFKGHAYVSRLKPKYNEYRKDFGRFILLQTGKKYDYEGIVKQLFGHININLHKLFCSEIPCAMFLDAGLTKSKVALWPGEFQKKTPFYQAKEMLF